jgi:hypothetical protein
MAMREMSSDGRERGRNAQRGERREAYFLLLNNRVGSEQFFPISQGMEKGREAAVVWFL